MLVFSMLFALTACSGGAKPAETSKPAEVSKAAEPTKAAKPAEIVIGGMQDMSGGASVSGNAMHRGAELAIEQINAAGGIDGIKIKYIAYDVKGDPQEAINAYNRLVDQDKATVIVGPPISNIGLAITSLTAEKKVPVVGAFIDSRCTSKADGTPQDYMFLIQPTNEQQAEVQASYAMDVLKLKKVALFYDQTNAFGVSQVKGFVKYVKDNGGQIVTEQIFKSGDKDFKTQLSKIKAAGAEVIFAPNYPQDNVLYVMQMNQLGINVPTMGGLDFAPPFLTLLPDAKMAKNIYFANNISDSEPKVKTLNEAYKAKYKEEATNKVYLGYDTVNVIAEAVKKANYKTDGPSMKAGLEQVTNKVGVTGTISFSAKIHQPLGLTMVMFMIENGGYKEIGRHVPPVK